MSDKTSDEKESKVFRAILNASNLDKEALRIPDDFVSDYEVLNNQMFDIILNKEMDEKIKLAKLEMLIKLGCDVNVKNKDGYTPLMLASMNGELDIVRNLLDNGAKVDEYKKFVRPRYEEDRLTDLALDCGYYDNLRYDTGKTALFYAVYSNHKEIAELLIQRGADVNMLDERGKTPLMFAVQNNAYECARLLVLNGANVNHSDDKGNKALKIAEKEMKKVIIDAMKERNENDETSFVYKIKKVFNR